MDIYEALKSGTDPSELIQTFQKDLEKAMTRLEEENKATAAAEQEHLADCRRILAEAIIEYAKAYFKDDINVTDFSMDTIEKMLIQYEKDMDEVLKFSKKLATTMTKEKDQYSTDALTGILNDDDIINAFLKSLK